MYGAVITVLVKGVMDVGGTDVVWQRNVETSHIEFFKYVGGLRLLFENFQVSAFFNRIDLFPVLIQIRLLATR